MGNIAEPSDSEKLSRCAKLRMDIRDVLKAYPEGILSRDIAETLGVDYDEINPRLGELTSLGLARKEAVGQGKGIPHLFYPTETT